MDLNLPGGWPYKGPLLKFLEWLCGELLRYDKMQWELQADATCLTIRKYSSGFVVASRPDGLYPTRP